MNTKIIYVVVLNGNPMRAFTCVKAAFDHIKETYTADMILDVTLESIQLNGE